MRCFSGENMVKNLVVLVNNKALHGGKALFVMFVSRLVHDHSHLRGRIAGTGKCTLGEGVVQ